MLKVSRFILSAITIVLAAYGLITQNFTYSKFMILSLGLLMLVMGIQCFKNGQKTYGWLSMIVFLFSSFVSIQGFILG
ncbi:DUF3953 domain-containing protein [Ornithinibacillus contaminans]|uniref:DUF3953 domain-containing protein n=1 Tax=Ornithinibacillus contaminans TaxID=694055 RepID=UPI00064DE8F4|nr:DUF3953 domain-containing protein [Ornithinibacillus contaminans]